MRYGKKVVALWDTELSDPDCRKRRDETNPIKPVYLEASAAMEQVQTGQIREMAKTEIFIEANPSSNLATGNIERLRDHPIFRIRRVDRGVRITLNCDDPGTFATRIENEYALLKDAMDERRMSPHEVNDFLEHLVASAERASFLRERPEAG